MTDIVSPLAPRTKTQLIGLLLGASLFLLMQLSSPPAGMSADAWLVASLGVLMVTWWVTEAIPIAATALAPMAVLPFGGVAELREIAAPYMSPIVILLMAGFIIAKAIEKWNLHERIALNVVSLVGSRPPALIGGFMIASALLSMWISNTATSLIMTPIALSVASAIAGESMEKAGPFRIALVLAVAYACSIGGLTTPVGSPTNLIVIGYLADQGVDVSFAEWMRVGAVVVFLVLPLAWAVLVMAGGKRFDVGEGGQDAKIVITERLKALGGLRAPEARTLAVFSVVALSWMFRSQIQKIPGFDYLNDQIIAVVGAIAFFILPSGARSAPSAPLLDWSSAERIPWGVVLLFGGGLSLASAMTSTGLAAYLATYFDFLGAMPVFFVVLAIVVLVLSMTEVTSNVATASALLPLIGAIALATDYDLMTLAFPLGFAASCAFMLPMATGPNAVAYASGAVSIGQMARIGFRVNLIAAIVISVVIVFLAPAL